MQLLIIKDLIKEIKINKGKKINFMFRLIPYQMMKILFIHLIKLIPLSIVKTISKDNPALIITKLIQINQQIQQKGILFLL